MSLIQISTPIPSPNASVYNHILPKMPTLTPPLGGSGSLRPPAKPRVDLFLAQYIKQTHVDTLLDNLDLVLRQTKQRDRDFFGAYLVKTSPRHLHHPSAHSLSPYNKYLSQVKQLLAPKAAPPVVAQKPQEPVPTLPKSKFLPPDFCDCPVDDLIRLIGRMMLLLIKVNDKQVPTAILDPRPETLAATNQLLTRYHSRTPPAISTARYLARLVKFNNFNQATLLTTIYYIDLLLHQYQPFFTLNSWTVHRFLLVATMILQKLMEDFFYTNDHYAKVGGVAISELNCLELDFLLRVDWRCIPAKQVGGHLSIKYAKDVLDLYYTQLVELMGKNALGGDNLHYFRQEDYDDMDDDDDDDDDYDEPEPYEPDAPAQAYDERGYLLNGKSSPHLKRRYSE